MAELNVIVKYKTAESRFLYVLMFVLLPFWAIAAPWALFQFLLMVFQGTVNVSACVSIFSLLPFIIASAWAMIVAEDNRIHITKEGLTFPLFLFFQLRFRRHRSWSELVSAGLLSSEKGAKRLVLGFSSGPALCLNLIGISLESQEQLLMGIELWGPAARRSDELILYQKEIQNHGRAIGTISYTQIWEDELRRRFSATSFVPLEPGAKLQGSKLEILRQLAFGGLSALYLAQLNGRDLVVVKEAVVPASADSALREQAESHLVREAEILSKLRHDRISKVLDHFVEDSRQYLILEYIAGPDLRQFVKQNACLSEAKAVEWGKQILELLLFLHKQDIPVIHRDLTPENLILNNQGDIVLIDFGAANQFVGTATGTVVGKQAYIPAEQLRGKAVIQSDIYAFGGTLYFLLTGEDPRALAVSHPKSLRPEISQEIDDIVSRCLAFEAADRYQNVDELILALNCLSPNLTVTTGQRDFL